MLKVTNLTKIYYDVKALDNISFTVDKGKITGFLGPNGAGKTTTMRILTGYLLPDTGNVSYEKKSLPTDLDKVITDIGYLPESNPLYKNMRVDEFLIFSAKMKGEFDKKELTKIAKICGIKKVLDKEIETLSKGFRQRVGLAKALIGNPKYLILDEPTEGLDPNQKEEILKLIKDISKEKTIIFSSHVLSEVTQVADNVIIINKGKIVAEGDKNDLVKEHFKNALISIKTDADDKDFKEPISDLKSVTNVQKVSSGRQKFNEYEVTCVDPEETALEIFNTIKENNWALVELHTKSQGLEELFRDLTK